MIPLYWSQSYPTILLFHIETLCSIQSATVQDKLNLFGSYYWMVDRPH